ncbi:putative F-box/LRR-repeat protein At4g15060 [Andrographis paniculata]|uniref:putative F-box/LRR-repeat protein At4g15060 n=1 Tax=Andrographis paniculata TaxID=175694 RepID=UPI0021E85CE3|nr:putative F-box/LRR-repeat protein At4g15060 [Andrographis paniculata]
MRFLVVPPIRILRSILLPHLACSNTLIKSEMESKIRRLRKNQEKEGDGDDLDGLSYLPDSILIHILSFLDTKSVVRISVLSKRYKHLWTSMQCLDFKLPEVYTDTVRFYDGYDISRSTNSSVDSFESYVNHVLKRREHSNLISFTLSLHKSVNLGFFKDSIEYAARHKVQHLRIRGYVKQKPAPLPKLLLSSSSLITLHLHNATSYCMQLPKSAALPSLKLLCLKKFVFFDENFNGEVFSGCPNLETLVLSKCCIRPGNKLKVLDVNCLNLKNLEIRNWRSPWRYFNDQMINVNAPKLNFFKLQGHLARVNFKDGLHFLYDTCIDFCCPTACSTVNTTERKLRTSEVFLNMLGNLSNVKTLSLSLKAIEVLSALPDIQLRTPLIFENLRYIRFSAEKKYKEKTIPIKTVVRLLERASTCVLVVDGSKEPKLSPDCATVKRKHKDATHIALPGNVMHFLLASAPSAEFLTIEAPQVQSDQD